MALLVLLVSLSTPIAREGFVQFFIGNQLNLEQDYSPIGELAAIICEFGISYSFFVFHFPLLRKKIQVILYLKSIIHLLNLQQFIFLRIALELIQ